MKTILVALALCLATGAALGAAGQAYPERPIRLIVPFPPGGGTDTDTFSRIIGARLGETLGQPLIIDNRGGAQGNIGTALGSRAAPDGYTITFAFVGNFSINPHLYDKPGFDTLRDFVAIGRGTEDAWVLVVHPSVKVTTADELAALARQYPGKLSNGSPSSAGQLLVDIFAMAAKAKIVHVHYKGAGPALIDLISGQVHLSFPNPAGVMPHIRSGKLRAVMVSSGRRHVSLPDVPHAMEAGYPDLDLTSWYGFAAPTGTPRAIVNRLNAEIVSALKHPETLKRLTGAGQFASPSTPEEFQEQIRRDHARWGKAAKATGAKVE